MPMNSGPSTFAAAAKEKYTFNFPFILESCIDELKEKEHRIQYSLCYIAFNLFSLFSARNLSLV